MNSDGGCLNALNCNRKCDPHICEDFVPPLGRSVKAEAYEALTDVTLQERDIERIDRICSKLAVVWKKCPEIPLGQLLMNIIPITHILVSDGSVEKALDSAIGGEP